MPLIPIHESPHLVVQAESEPLVDCPWFWVNGHRVPRAEITVFWHNAPAEMIDDLSDELVKRGFEWTRWDDTTKVNQP